MKIGSWLGLVRLAVRSSPIYLGLAFLVSAASLAAQNEPSDTTRSGGFQGPGRSEATIAGDSQPKDPLLGIPINFFDRWQALKTRAEASIGLTYGVSYQSAVLEGVNPGQPIRHPVQSAGRFEPIDSETYVTDSALGGVER